MKKLLLSLPFVFMATFGAQAVSMPIEEKIALQAAMSTYIDLHMVEGVIPHVMLVTGEVVDLVPSKAHPMVVALGEDFVLCTDFRDASGGFVNVDFYAKRSGERYVIFQTEIDNRAALEALMKAGKAAMVE